jgi:hypothetical protein
VREDDAEASLLGHQAAIVGAPSGRLLRRGSNEAYRQRAMTDPERYLLEHLADAGRLTPLSEQDLFVAQGLERSGFVMLIARSGEAPQAIIMPKGRHLLADENLPKKPAKDPFGFLP